MKRAAKATQAPINATNVEFNETVFVEQQHPQHDTNAFQKAQARAEDLAHEAMDRLQAVRGQMLSFTKRELIAHVVSFVTAFAGGYAGGMLLNLCFSAVVSLTGSMFLAWMVYLVGAIAVIYLGVKASQKVFTYIATGDIDSDIINAKNKVLGWFARNPLTAA